MFVQYFALIVCIVGLVIYWVATDPRPSPRFTSARAAEIGRIMFAFGLLALLLQNGAALPGLK
jgi:hypothetical protein